MSSVTTARGVRAPSAPVLAVAGSATIATAFGMARYGFGLLLPDIKADLALGATALGAVATLGYVAYVLAAALVTRAVARAGARATVVAGGVFAIVGTLVVALANGPAVLGAGVAIAGASAGLVYPPFADVVDGLPDGVRARTLATINCGTGWGVAVAAPIAIVAGDAWRAAYAGFAACAAVSTLLAARALPAGRRTAAAHGRRRGIRRGVLPMLGGAVLVGLGSAAFWTFAVEQVHEAGLGQVAARALLGVAGVASVLGIGAADLMRRLGVRRTFVIAAATEAAALVVVGVGARDLSAVLAAGAAFGAAYNTIVAVTVLWAARLYAERPSTGVAAAAAGNALGLLCGPLAAGALADAAGLTAALLAGAAVVLAAVPLAPRFSQA